MSDLTTNVGQTRTETAMTPEELRLALRIRTRKTFQNRTSLGHFDRFELKPRFGERRYSRKLVQLYLDKELSAPSWGAPRRTSGAA